MTDVSMWSQVLIWIWLTSFRFSVINCKVVFGAGDIIHSLAVHLRNTLCQIALTIRRFINARSPLDQENKMKSYCSCNISRKQQQNQCGVLNYNAVAALVKGTKTFYEISLEHLCFGSPCHYGGFLVQSYMNIYICVAPLTSHRLIIDCRVGEVEDKVRRCC